MVISSIMIQAIGKEEGRNSKGSLILDAKRSADSKKTDKYLSNFFTLTVGLLTAP